MMQIRHAALHSKREGATIASETGSLQFEQGHIQGELQKSRPAQFTSAGRAVSSEASITSSGVRDTALERCGVTC